jgi:5-methylcytosine-specific restriction endonuclease McrA
MRNFDDPQYEKWRADVRRRDGYKCKKCGSRKKLQVHHIKSWATTPQLRYSLLNGITLCKVCHGRMWGNEQAYERECNTLLASNGVLVSILKSLRDMEKDDV